MDLGSSPPPQNPKAPVNPWLLIALLAPLPLILFFFLFLKWYHQKAEYGRMTKQFVQRQNAILASDAVQVSNGFSDLLEKAVQDVQTLALVPPTARNYEKFYLSQLGELTQLATLSEAEKFLPAPYYSQVTYLDVEGNEKLRLEDGAIAPSRMFAACQERNLCDHALLEKARALKAGEVAFGSFLRTYTPEKRLEEAPWMSGEKGAGLAVAFRSEDGIFLLRIDYRHFKDFLTTPTFPYEPKRDLLRSYDQGDYVFIVDSNYDIIVHPKPSFVRGIDRTTGLPVPPMKTDADEGTHPLNIQAYQSGRLKDFFDRLLQLSFVPVAGVDIFHAPNLAGASRILSVAPIAYSKSSVKKVGVFGWVIIGCNVDYFEEPKERVVPYY